METKRITWYLGHGRAVIGHGSGVQAVFSKLNRRQRYWITLQGEETLEEKPNSRIDPRITKVIR